MKKFIALTLTLVVMVLAFNTVAIAESNTDSDLEVTLVDITVANFVSTFEVDGIRCYQVELYGWTYVIDDYLTVYAACGDVEGVLNPEEGCITFGEGDCCTKLDYKTFVESGEHYEEILPFFANTIRCLSALLAE